MQIKDWVKAARTHKKMTQQQLGDAVGRTKANVGHWETGKHEPGMEMLQNIARVTGFPPPILTDHINTEPAEIGSKRIPLISYIQAGHWAEIVDNFQPGDAEEWLYTDVHHSAGAFALEIKGKSMEPDFKEGDRVIIDPAIAPKPGSFVAAVNGQTEQGERSATFKKYRPRSIDAAGNVIFELVPLNEDYPTLRSDEHRIEIVGTMVEHRRYFR